MRIICLSFAAIALICGCSHTVIDMPDGYELVWHDEFDGKNIDQSKWVFEDWEPGYVNDELQRYVADGKLDGVRTAFVENGALNICAMKHGDQVISARMNSAKSWLYGWYEARICLPSGRGTWPAFWAMPDDVSMDWPACGELDIMEEVGYKPDYCSATIHCNKYNNTATETEHSEKLIPGAEGEFHVYAMEWTAEYITFYQDGKAILTYENDGTGDDSWPFNKPFYAILNLAWGGAWGGNMGVDETALPAVMKVDYVRVFQKNS